MRESEFRQFLEPRLGPRSVDSYLSNCARIERELTADLDSRDLSAAGLANIERELLQRGLPPRSVGNCMSALRSYRDYRERRGTARPSAPDRRSVPATERAQPQRSGQPTPRRLPPDNPPDRRSHRPALIRSASVRDLLVTHGEIIEELRHRGVVRTGNSPVGDYAELLFARAFGWTLASSSAAGYDATDDSGVRYQIKCRRITGYNASRQLSALRRLPERTFDVLAGILFDELYDVRKAALIPHEVVVSCAKWTPHTNSWRFLLDDKVWSMPTVRDVTAELTAAATGQ